MSDTDDTDDLLLIPPDFFVIDSETSYEPYYNIVDSLIKQVSTLKNRIDSIESISLNNSIDYWFDMQDNTSKFQKYNNNDDMYLSQSTQSTPQRPHTKFKLNSLPNSPNLDKCSPLRNVKPTKESNSPVRARFSPRSTKRSSSPERNDEHTLSEIDTFLSKVRTIQRINASRNLEKEFNNSDAATNTSNNTKDTVQVLKDAPTKISGDRDIKSPVNNDVMLKEHTWQQGDYKESVPNYGTGVRDLLYASNNKSQGDYIRNKPPEDSYSDSSSEITQATAYGKDRGDLLNSPIHAKALNLLSVHKQLLEEARQISTRNRNREPKPRGTNTMNDNYGLLSLADIWSGNTQILNANPSQMSQKLQEEKLRRQHCEELIQELQNRNLELQQKLSVALKVDESKNNTIQQFQEVLEKIVSRLERQNKEREEWEQEKNKLKALHSRELDEATQRVNYYEKEASKALNLAHSNQDKLSSLEKRCSDLQENLQSIERKCRELQEDYSKEAERNKHLSDILSQKENEVKENKRILNDARAEVAQSKRAVEACQNEFAGMKNECAKLQNDLKKEREHTKQLNEQRKATLNEIEQRKRAEEELKTEREKLKKQLESNKLELRHFYQGQVEILVQNKLKEFQSQLDQAEGTFKDELKKREMSLAKTAATHIQQISEKYSLEIKLLEQKHQEEIKLYQIEVMKHKQQTETLQAKLEHVEERKVHIANQLKKAMEYQWTEVLKIITSSRSPTFNDDAFSTIDQLNSLKTRSYNNVEEVLAQQQDDQYKKAKNDAGRFKDDMNDFQRNVQDLPDDTPVSSRQSHKQHSESEIQKYMSLLLNRPPGNPTQDGQQRTSEKLSPNITDRASWQPIDETGTSRGSARSQQRDRFPKPPWK